MPPPVTSPNARHNIDAFMGGTASRPHTRPPTPFNPSFSVPTTPPDLYLVTRNSPNLSQAVWENFQPDQLFPESASLPLFPQLSPTQAHQNLDANMMAQMQARSVPPPAPGQGAAQFGQQQQQQMGGKAGMGGSPLQGNTYLQPGMPGYQGQQGGTTWQTNFDGIGPDGQSPSDSWSTASAQGQPVPSTLNVEDW
jgi:hypothetical protein